MLLLAGTAIFSAMTWSLGLRIADLIGGGGFWLFQAASTGGFMLFWVAMLHFSLLFPRPYSIVEKRRWLVPLMYAAPFL